MRALLAVVGLFGFVHPLSATDDPKAVEFFERKVRPMLVEHCFKCHSAEAESTKKLKAGLLLDSRDAALKGGDSGPAFVPHKPADSLLLKTVKYDGDVKMPPKGKLPDAVIADIEKWIAMGAPGLPSGATTTRRQVGLTVEEGRKFWAYQPLPAGKSPNDIDHFIRAKLDAKGLKPAPMADKPTLVRRLYFDLIGLPPTPDEVDAFVTDASLQAYEKLVDKLLASPQFGERWGRHWLDVARYAESVTLRGFIFKHAWRYRDYVIESFNKDVPFDQFIREQIAGDLLPTNNPAERSRNLVATTFLMLGNTNLEEQDKKQLRMDVVDEQLDVVTKGFLAQTVTCARCHDHKFDPIPTKDYYALAGFFRNVKAMEHSNVSAWIEVPLPLPTDEEAVLKQKESEITALQAKIKTEKAKTDPKVSTGVLAVKDIPGIVVDDALATKVGVWQKSQHSGNYIGDGYIHDQDQSKGEKTLTFHPEAIPPGKYEVRLAYSPGTNRAEKVPVTVFSVDGEKTITIDMKKTPPLNGRYVSLGEHRFEKNGQCHVLISNEGTKGHVTPDAVVFLPLEKVGTTATTSDNKISEPKANQLRDLEAELKALQDAGPKRPLAMSVLEEKQIEETKVHVRGSVHNLGEVAPRGFLQVASVKQSPPIPPKESGRRELADWIAAPDNPLTARVIVNRTWHWLFGAGIVRTTDNFGTTGELPSHPELLDQLAKAFLQDGQSMKKLIRKMVLSKTYQQSSTGDAATVTADPENRLFGHANRRRLEAENIRDAMLTISGKLDLTAGGATYPATLVADYGYQTDSTRRSVYLPQFRNAIPELLEVFDAADPSTVTGRRNTSTVSQQSLFLLNHPFPVEQAKHATTKLLAENLKDDNARITRAYRQTLGREPTPGERQVATKFLRTQPDPTDAWAMLFHTLFASADFRFIE